MRKKDIPYEAPDKFRWTDIPTGICYCLMLLSLGLALAVFFRPLYYLNIKWLNIPEESGLNSVVIKENYDALIDYCSPFFKGELEFPSLRASESGLSHFAECKTLFNIIFIVGIASLLIVIISFIIKRKLGEYKYLRTAAIITVVLPLIVGIASAISFDALFLLFHRLVFNNDDWLFDPVTDPIINLLPETFFMECALLIVFVMLIGALIAFILFLVRKKNRKVESLLPGKKNYFY